MARGREGEFEVDLAKRARGGSHPGADLASAHPTTHWPRNLPQPPAYAVLTRGCLPARGGGTARPLWLF